MLLYERLTADTTEKGFDINSYELDVDNTMIGGKKMMVFWYVDDMKVSHVDPKEVYKFMEWIKDIYGELRITIVYVHDYLVMTLDLQTPLELRVIMVDYFKGLLEDLL